MPSPPEPSANPRKPPAARDFAAEEQINRLLTNANIQFRRGQTLEAEKAVSEVLTLRPNDAGAQELLGDIQAARGDFNGAQASYKAALTQEPSRATAEAKLARTILRQSEGHRMQSLGVAYAGADTALIRTGDGSDKKKTARLAIIGSALLPGLGQFVNGQTVKAGIVAGLFFVTLLIVTFLPETKYFTEQLGYFFIPRKAARADFHGISGLLWFLIFLLTADWVYAVVDAAVVSTQTSKASSSKKSGWEV